MFINNDPSKKTSWTKFLRNPHILKEIVGENISPETHVVEVGPGPGDLTEYILINKPKSLTIIEIDGDMIPLLQERFGKERFHLIHSDVLKVQRIENTPYIVYGNIPYYITSPIIHHFLYDITPAPEKMIITMQKEVADRILARDGKQSVLSLGCWLMADVEKICDISPNNFVPAPKVWSTCLCFNLKKGTNRDEAKKLLKIIELGFSQKRKKLISNLSNLFPLQELKEVFQKIGLDENVRAEDLSLENWHIIIDFINIIPK